MALPLYQLVTALILIVVGMALLGWRLGKERTRPEAISAIAALCLIGGVAFMASRALSSPDAAPWMQNVVYTMRAIPYDAGLIALSYFVIRSIGYKYPRTQIVLSYAPTVFGACWVSAFAAAFVIEAPALEEYRHFPPEFLLLKLRNIPELVWPVLAAVVFGRELMQREVSSRRLTAQRAAFFVAALGFAGLMVAAIFVNYLKVVADPGAGTNDQISLMLSIESISLAVAGIGWILGAVFDYSSEREDRLADQVEEWIKLRHDTEMMIDRQLGPYLSGGRGVVGSDYMINTFYRTYHHLSVRGRSGSGERQEDGEKLLHLLWVLGADPRRKGLINRLLVSQRNLVGDSNISPKLLTKLDSTVRYDVSSDPLFKAIGPALELKEKTAAAKTFYHWQVDHQLGLVVAADIGLLDPELNAAIKSKPELYVHKVVVTAYERAKEEMSQDSTTPHI